MKILLVSHYFWPESFIINEMVKKLAANGHEVTVATGKPNYPDGKIFEGYTREGIQREEFVPGVEIIRVPLHPRGSGGAKNLALNYLSFVFNGLIHFPRLLKGREFDAILVFGLSPILQAIPAVLLKWLKRAPLTIWIQDLWPESLEATGFIKNKLVLKGVGLVVRWIYACSDLLLVQSRAFFDPVAKYAAREKLQYFPNSISLDPPQDPVIPPAELSAVLREHFCVVFAGNIGAAQAMPTVVEAARLLRQDANIRIVLVGSGSMLEWVKEQKVAQGLDNLYLAGRFPAAMMPAIFEDAGALLVSLTDSDAFAQTVPSKIQAYLASGRPIVASVRGEAARILQEAGAGVSCPPENAEAMAASIRELYQRDAADREAMGQAGRQYFDDNFDMDKQVQQLVELLASTKANKARKN